MIKMVFKDRNKKLESQVNVVNMMLKSNWDGLDSMLLFLYGLLFITDAMWQQELDTSALN